MKITEWGTDGLIHAKGYPIFLNSECYESEIIACHADRYLANSWTESKF